MDRIHFEPATGLSSIYRLSTSGCCLGYVAQMAVDSMKNHLFVTMIWVNRILEEDPAS